MELKTLKDFEHDLNHIRIRAEAIKWVKELSKPKGYIEFGIHSFSWDDSDKTNWYTLAYRDVAKWTIMHLNNITEDDLQ